MPIVYDVEISVKVKTDEKDNPHIAGVTIILPNCKFEHFSSVWPEVLYQAEESKKMLERRLAEEKSAKDMSIQNQ